MPASASTCSISTPGPSKFEDLAHLTPQNLAWVQVCDLSGTPRELAGDSDRILPGEGDFQLGPIIEQLGADRLRRPCLARSSEPASLAGRSRIGWPTWGVRPCCACSAAWESSHCGIERRALRRVVGRDPPTRGGGLPRGTVLRLADLRLHRARARCSTGLGLSHGRAWSLEFGLGLAIGLGLLMVVIVFLLHMTTEVTPTRSSGSGSAGFPPIGGSCRSTTIRSRRSRHLPADRRLRLLGHPIRTRRRARADRTGQSRRPARADRRVEALDRQPAARAARRGDRSLVCEPSI